MLKIAICDDEQVHLDRTRAMLEQYAEACQCPCKGELFHNSSALLDQVETGIYHDIYLLDIYMPGVSGMSIATELRAKGVRSPIIFLTTSVDHAVEAFGVDATHYLLKPYTQQSFFDAMDKAVHRIADRPQQAIVLKAEHEYRSIPVAEILFCEAADKYQRIHTESGTPFLVRMTAAEIYEKLQGFGCFYRCGRSLILNLNHLSKITATSVLLKNGTQIPLPRTAIPALRAAFFDYFKESEGSMV